MNTKQSQIQKMNKNNIEWRKILSIMVISSIFLFIVVMLLLSTPPGREIFGFLCKFGRTTIPKFAIPKFARNCGSPASGIFLILIGTPLTAFILGAVTTKNKKFLHGILAGFLVLVRD